MALLDRLLEQYVSSCCAELFGHYGVGLAAVQGGQAIDVPHSLAGVIGFGGEQVKGSLMLTSTFAVIGQTIPFELRSGGEEDPSQLVDWIGELANQLIGRVKNRLLPHRVALVLSTPVSFSGSEIEQSRMVKADRHRVVLWGTSGSVRVCLEARVENELTVLAEPLLSEEANVASEGDLMLF